MARKNPEGRMRLLEHFREFRTRLLLIACGLVVGAIGGWFLFDLAFAALARPVTELQERGVDVELNFTTVAGAFDMRMRISIFLAGILTSPWWLYQIWAFVAPGLRRTEKRYTLLFLVGAVPLFAFGAVLGWLVLPHAVTILLSLTPSDGINYMDARTYLTFCMRIVFAFGIAFLFPVVMMALNLMGVVRGRTFLRGWRWAVVLVFTFAAVANPLPDPWTMIALGLLMTLFYFGAVGFAILVDRRRDRRTKKEALT